MKIGVPKEIKPQEHRIGLTPDSVKTLISEGHEVLVENNGGFEAGFENEQYTSVGAKIIDKAEDIFNDASLKISSALSMILAPTLVYCSFSKPASNPPLFSTKTSWPSDIKVLTLSGVNPIRCSCGLISLGTPIFITLSSFLIL